VPALAQRVAALLPGLMLGRVDGKSPAEYVTADVDKARIRAFARRRLATPVDDPVSLAAEWLEGDR